MFVFLFQKKIFKKKQNKINNNDKIDLKFKSSVIIFLALPLIVSDLNHKKYSMTTYEMRPMGTVVLHQSPTKTFVYLLRVIQAFSQLIKWQHHCYDV